MRHWVEIAQDVKTSAGAVFLCFASWLSDFIEYIPDDISKLGALLGVLLTCILIPIQFNNLRIQRKYMQEDSKKKLKQF